MNITHDVVYDGKKTNYSILSDEKYKKCYDLVRVNYKSINGKHLKIHYMIFFYFTIITCKT